MDDIAHILVDQPSTPLQDFINSTLNDGKNIWHKYIHDWYDDGRLVPRRILAVGTYFIGECSTLNKRFSAKACKGARWKLRKPIKVKKCKGDMEVRSGECKELSLKIEVYSSPNANRKLALIDYMALFDSVRTTQLAACLSIWKFIPLVYSYFYRGKE